MGKRWLRKKRLRVREDLTPKHLKCAARCFFGFWSIEGEIVTTNNAFVKLCKKLLLYHSTTSNSRSHMQYSHSKEFSRDCHDEGPALKQSWVTLFNCWNIRFVTFPLIDVCFYYLSFFGCKFRKLIYERLFKTLWILNKVMSWKTYCFSFKRIGTSFVSCWTFIV